LQTEGEVEIMATAFDMRVPPLTAGDKLTRAEFLRCWEAHPEIKNAELIGGIVFMPSPVSVEQGDMDGDVGCWLGTYKAATPGTASGHETTSFLLEDTPQPDNNLRILPEYGGGSWVEDKYISQRQRDHSHFHNATRYRCEAPGSRFVPLCRASVVLLFRLVKRCVAGAAQRNKSR
jgi:hypothetical protein